MDIKTLIFGVVFLFLIVGLFYFLTIFIQKVILKIRGKRNPGCNNSRDNNDNTEHNTTNNCGVNATKAILKAKENMRSK